MRAPTHTHRVLVPTVESLGLSYPKDLLCADPNCPQTKAVELLREMWQHSVVERIPDCDLDYKVEAFLASLEKK